MFQDVADWLRDSVAAVVLTGAGISTESGIPDFRSPGGVWSRYTPVYFDDFLSSAAARHEYWRQKCETHAAFAEAQPNAGHHVLAGWEAAGRIRGVITQNIDELHQGAGSQRVLELHGTTMKIICLDCREYADIEEMTRHFLTIQQVPPCPGCSGRLKHATVSFGQMLPRQTLAEAIKLAEQCDLMFAVGSSLRVTPAADLPCIAKRNGAKLVIINREPTPLDPIADAVLRSPIGETLTAIEGCL